MFKARRFLYHSTLAREDVKSFTRTLLVQMETRKLQLTESKLDSINRKRSDGFQVSDLRCRVPGSGFRVSGFGFRVSGFELQFLGYRESYNEPTLKLLSFIIHYLYDSFLKLDFQGSE